MSPYENLITRSLILLSSKNPSSLFSTDDFDWLLYLLLGFYLFLSYFGYLFLSDDLNRLSFNISIFLFPPL